MKFSTTIAKMLFAGVLIAFSCSVFAQQTYPSRPIRLLMGYPPGGSITVVANLLGQKLKESWGEPVILDYRPGGNTIIGTEALLSYPPDGHALLFASPTHVLNSLLQTVPYDSVKDFAPVGTVYSTEQVLVINPAVPAKNLQEFIAYAKSRPGQINYGTVSTGGTTHLAAEELNIMAGIKTQQVGYKGAAPAMTDTISGQVQMVFVPPASALPYIKAGRLRALAISGEKRLMTLPQVPTFAEAGLPDFYSKLWFGILVKAGTPKEIIDKLSTEIARIMAMPEVTEKLPSLGVVPFTSTPAQFAALMKKDAAMYAKIIKTANIKIQ